MQEKIELVKDHNPKLIENSYVLHNKATTNIFIEHQERSNLEMFINELMYLKLLDTPICDRKIYKDCVSEGKGIYDYVQDLKHIKALNEFESLISEINSKI